MDPLHGLALGRLAIGGTALTSPRLAARLFRLDAGSNPQLGYMTRLFGARELAMGVASLVASGETLRHLTEAGVAVDLADASAALLAGRDESVSNGTAVLLALPALGAAGTGAGVLARGER